MKRFFILLLASLTLNTQAQHRETRELPEFHGIAVSSGIDATFSKSSRNSATLQVDNARIAEQLETEVENGILYLRIKRNSQIRNAGKLSITVHGSLDPDQIELTSAGKLEITTPIQVEKFRAKVSSAGNLTTQNVQSDHASLTVGSAAKYTGQIDTRQLQATVQSAGKLSLSGRAKEVQLEASAAAQARLKHLQVDVATIDAKSGASVEVQVSSELNVVASSGGSVRYSGHPPASKIRESSGGRITKH